MLCCCKDPESPPVSKKQTSSSQNRQAIKSQLSNTASSPSKQKGAPKDLKQSGKKSSTSKTSAASPLLNPDSILLTEKTTLTPKMATQLEALVSRLEMVTNRLEGVAGGSAAHSSAPASTGATGSADSPFVKAYDEIINGPLRQFLEASEKIGGDVKPMGDKVKAAFSAQRVFLVMVSQSKQPTDQNALMKALQPTSQAISSVQEFRESHRTSKMTNHLAGIAESIAAIGWVTLSPKPAPFATELMEAGKFYTNRILKEFKDTDKAHVDWVKMWTETLTQLVAYIKQHHTTGLSWNPRGGDISAARAAPSAPPAPGRAGGPPPPPPPPAVQPPEPAAAQDSDDAGRAALFSELNKGLDVTMGLKKVSDDMKLHKNPSLRSGPQPFKPSPHASPKPYTAPKPGATHAPAANPAKPAMCKLEGKKWVVEYQKGNRNLIISETNMKQTVYIYKCEDSTVQVKGKINGIILDNCKKTGVVFDSLVSSLEFVNCHSVQGQALGAVPTVSIDKTDGCQIYLSAESANAEILSSKSSEMNILIPGADGEFKEYAVPQQFKTTFDGNKLTTEVTDSLGV